MNDSNFETERLKIGCRMFADLSQAQVEYASRIFRGLFILNGGAATALIAIEAMKHFMPVCIYGLGALFSVLSFAGGFFATRDIAETWRPYIDARLNMSYSNLYMTKGNRWILASGVFAGLSVLSFLLGSVVLFCKLHNTL